MYLVDTSVWIDWLSRTPKVKVKPDQLLEMVTCPPVVQEILQGVSLGKTREILKDRFLSIFCVGNPVTLELYLRAADIYVEGRVRGLTIRSSIDCLIAAIAMENHLPIWHKDRDYDKIAKFTPLKIYKS